MTPIIDTAAVTLHHPTSLAPSFLGLEAVVLGLAALTFVHALRAHRRGETAADRAALLTWVTILVYGLVMEIVSYNAFDNFAHGQFTVMFYERQLPLYVTAVYPVLLYTGIATARRLGLPPLVEALAAGLFIVAMDAPFDVAGPPAGWWRWYDTDPNIAYRWLGVPVTSYFWHFSFGGILAAITAWASRRGARALWLSIPLSALIIVLGMLGFAPFHVLKSLGVADGVIVGCALALAGLIVAAAPRRAATSPDRGVAALWIVFYGYHAAVIASLVAASATGWGPRVGFVAGAGAIALALRHAGALRPRRPDTLAS
jgi:hypothetical protein